MQKNTSINSCSNSANRHLIIYDDDEFKSLEGNSLRKSDSNDSISHEWNVNDSWSEINSVVTNESNTKRRLRNKMYYLKKLNI